MGAETVEVVDNCNDPDSTVPRERAGDAVERGSEKAEVVGKMIRESGGAPRESGGAPGEGMSGKGIEGGEIEREHLAGDEG